MAEKQKPVFLGQKGRNLKAKSKQLPLMDIWHPKTTHPGESINFVFYRDGTQCFKKPRNKYVHPEDDWAYPYDVFARSCEYPNLKDRCARTYNYEHLVEVNKHLRDTVARLLNDATKIEGPRSRLKSFQELIKEARAQLEQE